jgi:predicted Zn-dependent protease
LLAEIAETPETRETEYYAAYLPALVRSAIVIGDPVLAERFTTGLAADKPYNEHALVTATAAMAEARGDLQAASNAYADAAARWERFGVVPEQAYALLGYGRCLVRLGRPGDATPILRQARVLFGALDAQPAVAVTDALLKDVTALSS